MSKLALLLCLLATGWTMGVAQSSNQQTPTPAAPSAKPATALPPAAGRGDVDTIQHILAAVYDVISGPAGAPRDWDRFLSLYYPGARLIPSRRDDKGVVTARVLSPEEYVTRGRDAFASQGFFENPIANRIEAWDHLAHVWSAYESRHAKGEKPFARGINSFQLFNDGTRWWILTIYWEGEDKDHPLPEKYLK
ncbi:MAG TPA: hypothetical protein VI488_22015 [Candidatus Angelobacter sp.]